MKTTATGFELTEEEILALEVPDECLEIAAGTAKQTANLVSDIAVRCRCATDDQLTTARPGRATGGRLAEAQYGCTTSWRFDAARLVWPGNVEPTCGLV